MKNISQKFLLLAISIILPLKIYSASKLSPVALYNRCYAQITGHRPLSNDLLTQQVANNTIAPITACMQVLNKALLTTNTNTTIANTSDAESLSVLRNMHNLHSSWFLANDFTDVDAGVPNWTNGSRDLWDSSTPALYLTKALFESTPSFSSILSGSAIYTPVRTMMDPTNGAATNLTKANYVFTTPFQFAPRGALIGVQEIAASQVGYPQLPTGGANLGGLITANTAGTVPLYGSLGGGLIGNYTYALLNINQNQNFIATGGTSMPRKWGRAVFKDLFCRDLPVIRPEDAVPFVDPKSTVAFRTTSSCVACHASMDRMSSVVRNVRYTSFANDTPMIVASRGATFVSFPAPTKPAEASWPTSTDSSYAQRPATGTLYFRNYLGNLVDVPVSGTSELATQIANQDDFYICTAKRYYAHFTGITVDTGDLSDPRSQAQSAISIAHRNEVINLGKSLRQHNNLRTLINDILNLPQYQKSDSSL